MSGVHGTNAVVGPLSLALLYGCIYIYTYVYKHTHTHTYVKAIVEALCLALFCVGLCECVRVCDWGYCTYMHVYL